MHAFTAQSRSGLLFYPVEKLIVKVDIDAQYCNIMISISNLLTICDIKKDTMPFMENPGETVPCIFAQISTKQTIM